MTCLFKRQQKQQKMCAEFEINFLPQLGTKDCLSLIKTVDEYICAQYKYLKNSMKENP